MQIRPFSNGDTSTTFRNLIESTVAEIKSLDNNHVLNASPTELEQFYMDKVKLHPLTLHTPTVSPPSDPCCIT